MKISVSKSRIKGKISAPASKSYTIRGLMCAALADGDSDLLNPLSSDDTEAAIDVLSKLGIRVRQSGNVWRVTGGKYHEPNTELFCHDSAATLRFTTAICSLIPGKCRLTAGPSLSLRPVNTLIEALRQLGIRCSSHGELPPVTIKGGSFKGGLAELPGDISSQFVSALLLLSPFAEDRVTIRITSPLESKPYVAMTLDSMAKFGIKAEFSEAFDTFKISKQTYRAARYKIEGDWSSASYFLALGTISGETEIDNLSRDSLQGDKIMLNWLRDMGVSVKSSSNSVAVNKSKLKPVKIDLSDGIDLLPTMAVLSAVADGVSEFTGIARARLKESNRVASVKEGLERMGVKVTEERNRMTITGSNPHGAVIDSKGDHRIAMAFSILGSLVGGTIIEGAECVTKTYPEFWNELKSIGGEVKINGQ